MKRLYILEALPDYLNLVTTQALPGAYRLLRDTKGGSRVIKAGGAFGDIKNDTELKADKVLGEFLGDILRRHSLVGHVSVEGGEDQESGHDGLWVTIDPLDGSLNYRDRGPVAGFPYSVCVTMLAKRHDATFNDILGGAVMDLRTGDVWTSIRDVKDRFHTSVNSEPARTHSGTELDLGKMNIVAEFYYPENREIVTDAFRDMKGWLRSPGSAAYEMASVSTGQAAAFICRTQKQHELGAGYALVKGAGGVGVDWSGEDLGPRPYNFKSQTEVVLAANQPLATQIIDKLQRALLRRS